MRLTTYLPGTDAPTTSAEAATAAHADAYAAALMEIATGDAGAHVDVLASGPGYLVYAIFDCQAARNPQAEAACIELTGEAWGTDEDNELRGPIVIIQL